MTKQDNAARLTPWFPADVKPIRKGSYLKDFDNGRTVDLNDLQYWDGRKWHYGPELPTLRQRQNYIEPSPRRWRGLANPPKGQQ